MTLIENNMITITRGDTFEAPLHIHDCLNDTYTPGGDEIIRFALKSSYRDKTPLIIKQIDPHLLFVRLEASETEQLRARTVPYVYDVEIRTPDNSRVVTIISGELYVKEEVCV